MDKQYIIIDSTVSLSDLEGGVNYRMDEGYKPVGGVMVTTTNLLSGNGTLTHYYQAMVRQQGGVIKC